MHVLMKGAVFELRVRICFLQHVDGQPKEGSAPDLCEVAEEVEECSNVEVESEAYKAVSAIDDLITAQNYE